MWLFYTNSSKVEKEEIFFLKHKGIKLPTDYRNKTSKSRVSKNDSKVTEKIIIFSNLLISKAEIISCTSVQPKDWDWRALFRRQCQEILSYVLWSCFFSGFWVSIPNRDLELQGFFPQLLGTRAVPRGKPQGWAECKVRPPHLLPSGSVWVALWSCSCREVSQAK